ncbi:hypothetical protein CVAR21S_02756 [Corynebacterium variabile]
MSLKDAAVSIAGRLTDRIHIGNGLDQRELSPVGWFEHGQAVQRLTDSFAAVPADKRVRLAKKTSNLFRGRSGDMAGLDVSGLHSVIAVDPVDNTADVQGMCTYEDLVDTLLPFGLVPTVVPQLKTITLGGAVTGMGVESTSFRNGLPHEAVLEMDVLSRHRRDRHLLADAERRPLPRFPELLRLAGLLGPAEDHLREGARLRRTAPRPLRRRGVRLRRARRDQRVQGV